MPGFRGAITKEVFLRDFTRSLVEETGSIFVGAGVSMAAGYPSWKTLLHEIGQELGVDSGDVSDLAALAQWHIRRSSGATKIRQVIRDNIAVEHPIPEALETVARLPIRQIWTTNYDRLIERAYSRIGRPLDVISVARDISLKPRPSAVRLYKMHGSADRLDDLVISTDDYELFRAKRGAFLPLLHAHLASLSFLFVGLSFTDQNVRHVLSLIREAFTDAPPEHFAIVRPPVLSDYRTADEFNARLTQHQLWADDLQRYGLRAVEIAGYDEIPHLLNLVERTLARHRVWVSGSWPLDDGKSAEYVYAVANALGRGLGSSGLTLVSGSGLLVGSASMSGFLAALQEHGSWDLERRLIARPFPQPLAGASPDRNQWQLLRAELGRLAGFIVFVGGEKIADGKRVLADGVFAEREIAENNGAFLIPIGATGGAAKQIAQDILANPHSGRRTPTNAELLALMDPTKSPGELTKLVLGIIQRASFS